MLRLAFGVGGSAPSSDLKWRGRSHQILFQKVKIKYRHRIRFDIQRVIVLGRKLVAMIALNWNPLDRLEFVDVGNTNPVRPVLRIQPKDRRPRCQITELHSSGKWVNMDRGIM